MQDPVIELLGNQPWGESDFGGYARAATSGVNSRSKDRAAEVSIRKNNILSWLPLISCTPIERCLIQTRFSSVKFLFINGRSFLLNLFAGLCKQSLDLQKQQLNSKNILLFAAVSVQS